MAGLTNAEVEAEVNTVDVSAIGFDVIVNSGSGVVVIDSDAIFFDLV
ncbi:hypothetical protein [Shewanella sp. ENK2]